MNFLLTILSVVLPFVSLAAQSVWVFLLSLAISLPAYLYFLDRYSTEDMRRRARERGWELIVKDDGSFDLVKRHAD